MCSASLWLLYEEHSRWYESKEFSTCSCIQDEMQVAALKRMIQFLDPGVQRLFQCALLGCRDRQKGPWFARMALGHNQLKDMMPNLSVRANLSKRYTNHCLRATVVTTLTVAGFFNPEVCAVTGYQSHASIENYDRLDREGSKRPSEMAAVLDGKANVPTCVPAAKRLQLKSLQDRDALSKTNEGLFSLSASNCTSTNLQEMSP